MILGNLWGGKSKQVKDLIFCYRAIWNDKAWELSDVRLKHFIVSSIRNFKKTLKSHQSQVDGGHS